MTKEIITSPYRDRDLWTNCLAEDPRVLLAQSLQKRGISGIRISDEAKDNRGRSIPGYQAIFASKDAKPLLNALSNSPEITILTKAINPGFHKGGDPRFVFDDVIPTFATDKRRRQLTALYWHTDARHLRKLAEPYKSGALDLVRQAQAAQSRVGELLSPNWLNLTLPSRDDIAFMVEDVVNKRLPLVNPSVKSQ
jgi:hypothetical protein